MRTVFLFFVVLYILVVLYGISLIDAMHTVTIPDTVTVWFVRCIVTLTEECHNSPKYVKVGVDTGRYFMSV